VLVTCCYCACRKRCTVTAGEPAIQSPEQPATHDVEARRSALLLERVRTKLTVIHGFAQLLRRSRRLPPGQMDEVERITAATGELNDLLARYESHGWPAEPEVADPPA
jgi:hypothetical protein